MKLNDVVTKVYAFFKQSKAKSAAKAIDATTETASTQTQVSASTQASSAATSSQPAKKHKSKLRRTLEPIVLALAAILCFTYPVASTLWNNNLSKEISAAYDRMSKELPKDARIVNLEKAREYNAQRSAIFTADPYNGSDDYKNTPEYKKYESVLDEPMGIMGIVKIPKIGVKLPIYHGSSTEVLAQGAGHLYGTDLPVGGKTRHSVVTAHTGLPHATMFDDLIYLKKGDYFYFDIQGETLRYRVFRINVVEPNDISMLQREKGRDLATLLTCTPYGVNTQRLLVTGYRVLPDPVSAPGDKLQWPLWMTMFVLALIGCAVILATMIIAAVRRHRKNIAPHGRHLN
ncbi:class C sortase [Gardnerella vaginalis]|uniref:class C sortase n=1 Tax=Gardnerella vaginalis TaxID=2702 RepID=UPI0039F0E4B1